MKRNGHVIMPVPLALNKAPKSSSSDGPEKTPSFYSDDPCVSYNVAAFGTPDSPGSQSFSALYASALISAGGGKGTDNLWSGTVVAHDSAAAVKVADGVGKRVGETDFCAR